MHVSSPSGVSIKICCNLTPGVTTEMSYQIFFLTINIKHAVHLIMCKSYQGLDDDPARGGVGSNISRTTTSEFLYFSRTYAFSQNFSGLEISTF